MKSFKRAIIWFVCGPWNLFFAWPAILLLRAIAGENLRWEKPDDPHGLAALTCDLRAGAWFTETFYTRKRADGSKGYWGGTTLGHAIFYGPGRRQDGSWARIQRHEHVHVEQHEAHMLSSFIVGLITAITVGALGHSIAGPVIGMVIWTFGYLSMGVGGWTVAWLRGEDPYRGSYFEEAAYAIDDDEGHGHG